MNSQADNSKRFFIKTLGCKVNQYESQAMREILLRAGFKECLARDIADIYILNTCTVTNRADKESRYWLGFFHKANPKAKIVVTGCYVERDSNDISFLPGIAHIIKNDEKNRIAEILTNTNPVAQYPMPTAQGPYNPLTITDFKNHTKAFVKIQDGCENCCSYCKVPLVRGPLRSRPVTDILKEVKILVEKGFKEIVLTGVCLGAWGKDPYTKAILDSWPGGKGLGLVDVLKAMVKIPGDFRMRLSSIEPRYVTEDLIDFISKNRRICRHLHIPFQSGDDEILKKMDRPYTAEGYRAIVDKARSRIEDVAITTDILIGFPGESDKNFKNTMDFIREILPARTHIFTFSQREGTKAHGMEGLINKAILKKRYYELEVAALSSSYIYRKRFMDKKLDILVETKRDRLTGLLTGYSDNYIKVLFDGPDSLMKEIVPVTIEDMTLSYTLGRYEPV
ncbi:MAG: tRNA (N(6)-L-threonylcarbamoyladenosine(37)-C(2))-methylthiotransferase MtaB [Candidatus Omnitrophica bacterium]|nr:tRNA (N(6)-L-threonylcarbamoyladenosine(37)-C(2))-methylthiotransferase MtaB [Candidatus Omnitrophota bacterium]